MWCEAYPESRQPTAFHEHVTQQRWGDSAARGHRSVQNTTTAKVAKMTCQ